MELSELQNESFEIAHEIEHGSINDVINSMCWSHDGSRIVGGTDSGQIISFVANKGHNSFKFQKSLSTGNPISIIKWLPNWYQNKNEIVVGCQGGVIRTYNINDRKCTKEYKFSFHAHVEDLCFVNKTLCVLASNQKVYKLNLFEDELKLNEIELDGNATAIASDSADKYLTIAEDSDSIKLYDLEKDEIYSRVKGLSEIKQEGNYAISLCWSPDDKHLVAGYANGRLLRIESSADFNNLFMDWHTSFKDKKINSLSFSSDNLILSVGCTKGVIEFVDTRNWINVLNINEKRNSTSTYRKVVFNPKTNFLAGFNDEKPGIRIYKIDTNYISDISALRKDSFSSQEELFEKPWSKHLWVRSSTNFENDSKLISDITHKIDEKVSDGDFILIVNSKNNEAFLIGLVEIEKNDAQKSVSSRISIKNKFRFPDETKLNTDKLNEEHILNSLLLSLEDNSSKELLEDNFSKDFINFLQTRNIEGIEYIKEKILELWSPLEPFANTDTTTLDDELGHKIYAQAIARFLEHPKTKSPLSIGIFGEWGEGKTNLMRLIKRELEKNLTKNDSDESNDPINYRQLLWTTKDYKPSETVKKPFVWFNPWKYEKSNTVWAGLASSLVGQLVNALPNRYQKEKFWFSLKLQHIDKTKLRNYFLKKIIPGSLTIIAVFCLILYFFINSIFSWEGLATSILSALAFAGNIYYQASKEVSGKFNDLISEPDFNKEKGAYKKAEDYVQKALDILVDKDDNPVIVFIDDLDRCSYSTVVEVFESINKFLSNEFKNCIFVIGIDPRVVTAILNHKYEALFESTKSFQKYDDTSIGWHYINKFIQLSFTIPKLTKEISDLYLESLFPESIHLEEQSNSVEQNSPSEQGRSSSVSGELNDQQTQFQKNDNLEEEIELNDLEDNRESILNDLKQYSTFFGSTPRTIKKYLNNYRLSLYIQYARKKFGYKYYASPDDISFWVCVNICMPNLINWIRTGDRNIIDIETSGRLQRAKMLDELIDMSTLDNFYKQDWEENVEQVFDIEEKEHWINQKQVFNLLSLRKNQSKRFVNAVKTNVY